MRSFFRPFFAALFLLAAFVFPALAAENQYQTETQPTGINFPKVQTPEDEEMARKFAWWPSDAKPAPVKDENRRRRVDDRPLAGTRLIREWNGQPHEVVVNLNDFEYAGQRYKSLSRIARVITGTNRNGWTFFGFSSARGLK